MPPTCFFGWCDCAICVARSQVPLGNYIRNLKFELKEPAMTSKTLILKWTETHEMRVLIREDISGFSATARAIEDAVVNAGFTNGSRVLADPESISFRIEES